MSKELIFVKHFQNVHVVVLKISINLKLSNFNKNHHRWLKTNAAGYELLSEKCLNAYKEIICYDCDADVAQGIRKGLCPQICEGLYNACIDDHFRFNKEKLSIFHLIDG